MSHYLIRYSVHFHYYSFSGNKKSEVRSGESKMEGTSVSDVSERFRDYYYKNKESYFVSLPEFGWKLTHLVIDKVWEPRADLDSVLHSIWTYYENLIKRVGEGPLGRM
tara:strand:- start:365 stop:688 length:324 start_codon:yes stop_codon:yes gene_type:complete